MSRYALGTHMKRKPCPNEAAHNDDGPRDYMSRAEWAENKLRTHDQKQCPGCDLWLIWEPKATAPSDGQPTASAAPIAPGQVSS